MRPTITRRDALGCLAASAWTVVRTAKAQTPTKPPFEVLDVKSISHLEHRYHGWPTLARRRNGELLLVCSGGREAHVCPFGRVELMKSRDGGRTWTWPRVVMDGPIDDRDAGVVETAKGSILITSFSSLAYESLLQRAEKEGSWPADKLARWRAVQGRTTAEQRQRALGVWMIRSTDGGVTFSGRYDCLVDSPHGPIQLTDGRLLYAGKDLWREGHRVGVCQSGDDGQTWQWLAEIAPREGDTTANYHELHAAETQSGRIIVQIRNHNRQNAGETLQCHSVDGGKTWTKPRSIGVWGLPSHLLTLPDGRLLMTYGYRRKPFGNRARISEDEGDTWSEAMVIYGEGTGGDLGYPSTVMLDDRTLVTVWYERLAGSSYAVLRQARWRLTG